MNKSKIVLEIHNVKKIFNDNIVALNDISFCVAEGEFVVIAGANGSGKSVLMSLIAKLDEADFGTIDLHNISAGLVFQDADAQILGETPFEDVSFGAKNCGLKKEALSKCVDNALLQVGLYSKKDHSARNMSGGEKRRLAVAGIIAMNHSLIIFDEPYANLDWPGIKQVNEILKKLKEEGKTIIVLTHELEKVLALANRFLILDKGKICFDGSVEEGLKLNLEQYSIRNPLRKYETIQDLLWK